MTHPTVQDDAAEVPDTFAFVPAVCELLDYPTVCSVRIGREHAATHRVTALGFRVSLCDEHVAQAVTSATKIYGYSTRYRLEPLPV